MRVIKQFSSLMRIKINNINCATKISLTTIPAYCYTNSTSSSSSSSRSNYNQKNNKYTNRYNNQNNNNYNNRSNRNNKPNQQNQHSYYHQKQQYNTLSSHKIDPSYWEKLLPTIEPKASKLVTLLLNPSSHKKQIIRQLQEYLEFRNTTFTPNVRTDLGCLAVLIAMNQTQLSKNYQEYENRIVDFVTLADISYSPFDHYMVKYVLSAIHKRMGMNLQKNVRQYYRLKLVEIALDNFQKIQDKDLMQIITIVQDSLEKDKMNFITKWRFYPLLEAIEARIMKLMLRYVETSDYSQQQEIQHLISSQFLYKFLHIIYFYSYMSVEHANIFYNFLVKRDNLKKQDYHYTTGFMNSMCYVPYVEMANENGKVITLRQKLLEHFQTNYNNSSTYRMYWKEFSAPPKRYLLQRFFEDSFHSVFKSLPFRKVNDKYLVLDQKSLIKPQVPEFVWKLFKANEKLYLQKYILNDVIKSLYPENISLPKQSIPTTITKTASFSTDNEANLKIWQALDSLGLKYKKEQNRAQRNVDLVIEEKIIVQVDGQGHYSYLNNEIASDTSFRNLHLLLSGYKLVIISMYEYNNNRSLEEFSRLIKEKIDIASEQGVVYVC